MSISVYEKGMQIVLNDEDFIYQGGEGTLYSKKEMVYKIYHDREKMIPDGKIKELSALNSEFIITPKNVLLDSFGRKIGYSMSNIKDNHSLMELFTRSFKERHGLRNENEILYLVKKSYDLIKYIHNKEILFVDLNELNLLVDCKFKNVYAIDTNSFQTPSYPATALMNTVKDFHSKEFSVLTDWFSWGIVTFQMFVGIHPYRHKHEAYNGKLLEIMEERMKKNVSIFDPGSRVPKVAYSFDTIPSGLRDWYFRVFQKGERIQPPENFNEKVNFVIIIENKEKKKKVFEVLELERFNQSILRHLFKNGERVVVLKDSLIFQKIKHNIKEGSIVGFGLGNTPISLEVNEEEIIINDIPKDKSTKFVFSAKEIVSFSNGDIYARSSSDVVGKLVFNNIVSPPMVSFKPAIKCLSKVKSLYDGVLIQKLLNKMFVTVFELSKNISIDALNEYKKITDAKYENGVLFFAGVLPDGSYERMIIVLNKDGEVDNIYKQDSLGPKINAVVLDKGIIIILDQNEDLTIMNKSGNFKVVEDNRIDSTFVLSHELDETIATSDNKVFSIKG